MARGSEERDRRRRKAPSHVLYIGDNLPVLRGLDSNSIILIYLNPPHRLC